MTQPWELGDNGLCSSDHGLSSLLLPHLILPQTCCPSSCTPSSALAIGMAWMDTAVVQPLFPHDLKNPLPAPGHHHHQNGFFSLWLQRKFPTARSVLHTRHSAGPCLNGAQLENAPWCSLRCSGSGNDPALTEGQLQQGTACLGHLCISCPAPLQLLLGSGSWGCCLCHPSPVLASNQSPWWCTDLTFQPCSVRTSCRWLSGESADKTKQKSSPRPVKKPNILIMPWTLDQIYG